MLIDRVCGLNEMELSLKNENRKPKSKLKKRNENEKSNWDFQSVFENELNRLYKNKEKN